MPNKKVPGLFIAEQAAVNKPGTISHLISTKKRDAVAEEMADVLIYLVRLADSLDVDLLVAAERKLAINVERYPVEKVKGRGVKYDEL